MDNNADITKLATETRDVYLKQHNKYLSDEVLFSRFFKMVSDPSYYHLTAEDFAGKHILDAGCGNTAYFEVAMCRLGVGRITCLDIGEEWKAPLSTALDRFNVPRDLVEYVSGSTDALPFEDGQFDIVFSNGVLMHLYDLEQVNRAFRELARVTKPGGLLYIILGVPGGLLETELLPALRRYYRSNQTFREMVDTATPATFVELFNVMRKGMAAHTGEALPVSDAQVEALFDVDFCAFLQNLLQVPNRIILELDEAWAHESFHANGFETPQRCRRYVERQNVRRFFAPLHFDSSNRFSQILYGPGNLEYIARKRS